MCYGGGMRLLFAVIGLLGFSLSATAASEWLYYKEYPWVYDNVSKDWLYLRGAADGSIYAYRSKTNKWEVFTAPKDDDVIPVPTWKEQYNEWVQNPEPYGGLSVLQKIKEAIESGATEVDLYRSNIRNISPLAGLTDLTRLAIDGNSISDLTPIVGLTFLTWLDLEHNSITDISPLAELTNLSYLDLVGNNVNDFSSLAELSNLTELELAGNNISDLSPLLG